MATQRIPNNVIVDGTIQAISGYIDIPVTSLEAQAFAKFAVPFNAFRVWDSISTNLPNSVAGDDLALTNTSSLTYISAGDVKATSSTRYARFWVPVPANYKVGGSCKFVVDAGMQTTIADTSCVVDFEVYLLNEDLTASTDICATAAQSINSLTFAEKAFNLTVTNLAAGDLLDCRMAVTWVDAATATGVTPSITKVTACFTTQG